MSRLLIRGGRLLDPSRDLDEAGDCLIEDGRISALRKGLPSRGGAEVLDAEGAWVAPGFVDLHAHLREPGQEYKEDLASGGTAAVAGGFSQVACMPNTDPVNDDPAVTEVHPRSGREGLTGAHPADRRGDPGAQRPGDDRDGGAPRGRGHRLQRRRRHDHGRRGDAQGARVLEARRMLPVIVHAEDCNLRGGGVVNEGPVSRPGSACLGIRRRPRRSWSRATCAWPRSPGAHLHVAHVSTAGSVELIRRARRGGSSGDGGGDAAPPDA